MLRLGAAKLLARNSQKQLSTHFLFEVQRCEIEKALNNTPRAFTDYWAISEASMILL